MWVDLAPPASTCRGRLRAKREAAELPGSEKRLRKHESSSLETNPMDVLVKAASALNPKQFELPREMGMSIPFPGTDKGMSLWDIEITRSRYSLEALLSEYEVIVRDAKGMSNLPPLNIWCLTESLT